MSYSKLLFVIFSLLIIRSRFPIFSDEVLALRFQGACYKN